MEPAASGFHGSRVTSFLELHLNTSDLDLALDLNLTSDVTSIAALQKS